MDWDNHRAVWLLLCLGILLATIHDGNAERKIVCYYTNWSIYRPGTAKFSPQNINPYLCTHLIYAFGGFTKDNALKPFDKYQDIEKGGYAKFTGLKTYNKNLKTLLAIGGWNEGSSRFSPMVADPGRRREFVKNAIKFLRKNHFDGLDLDWEYPAFRDGGKPRDKDNYANLVQELREEFERESSKTGRPRLLLTLAMPAGIEYIDKGYDIFRLNEYLDFINLLSYDYHSSYEPAVNHHSPLYPLEEDNEYNYDSELTIDYTIDYLLKKGASPEKVMLGIPTYGRSYTLFNQDATDLGSPADGPGVEGDATREKGYLAYYEICESLARSDEWEVIQPNPKAMGPYAFKGDQWVGYDDEDMVRLKARYANEKNLGGIMFWTIDNDDFRGKCHDRPYPLIEAAKEALLNDETNTVDKPKTVASRKKPRAEGTVRSNTIGRKLGSNARRSTTTTTTTTAAPKKRITSSRPKYRTFSRSKASSEERYNEGETEEEEEEEQEAEEGSEVSRRSYDPYSDEEELGDRGNAVRSADKNERSNDKGRGRQKSRYNSSQNRRKKQRRKESDSSRRATSSSGNKLTTPEPPTTPDPGTDFKCEDEGFFPHPRDCKKYFWCLDSGPGGLGIVAHQFTCPSGLVFNKAADSCDYPRNVVCPKSKTSQSTVSTTRAPVIAATSRTTYLYSTTRRPSSTPEPDSEEEYEYYDDDDDEAKEETVEEDEEEEEDEEAEEEEKEAPRGFSSTTTPKTLLYKTIARNKPSSSTTTTSTAAPSTTSKSEANAAEKVLDLADEEDPRVIKELIMLIKKAGGIEQLEKQLLFQDKNLENAANSGSESVTPATISRTLYERVLNRQAGKTASRERLPANNKHANGPGSAQFEGLDQVPEVQSLRRSQKPQYVTIERPKSSTREPTIEEKMDEEEEEEEEDQEEVPNDHNENAASSSEEKIGTTQRVTPNYINIRRARPSTSRNENDVGEKAKDKERGTPARRRRPATSSKSTENGSSERVGEEREPRPDISEEKQPTTKSRYVSALRFRSTTPQSVETVPANASSAQQATTESIVSSEAPKTEGKVIEIATPVPANLPSLNATSSTPTSVPVETPETEKPISTTTTEEPSSSTTESVKLVEDSATEILLTTAPASLFSTISAPNTRIETASVSQPRPFGFNRRNRPPSEFTTTPLPAISDQTRSKVANSEVDRLPTLKELIGYQTNDYSSSSTPVFLSLLPLRPRDESDNVRRKQTNRVLETAAPRQLDLSEDKVDAYYAENNIAADENDASLTYKKRFDRDDSSTTTLRPTTMRGIPLADLLQSQTLRGFYVTVSEAALRQPNKTQNDTSKAGIASSSVEKDGRAKVVDEMVIGSEQDDAGQHRKYSKDIQLEATTFRLELIANDIKDRHVDNELPLAASSEKMPSSPESETVSTNKESQHTTPPIDNTDARETGLSDNGNATKFQSVDSLHSADENEKLPTSTTSSRTVTQRVKASVPQSETVENNVDGRQRNVEFGRKFQSRGQARRYVRPSNENRTESIREGQNLPYPRRRGVPDARGYREPRPRKHRGRTATRKTGTTIGPVKEFGKNSFMENQSNEEGLVEEETNASSKLVPKSSRSSNHAVFVEESLRIDGVKTEEKSSTNTVTPRASGNLPPTRLRKPPTSGLTSLQNKSPNEVANPKKTRPADGNATLVNEKVGAIDQSGRAQEVAVTLADPPSLQSPVTGRPSFRKGLRRKISTTVAPRTDATTSRTTLRLASILRDRQGPTTKDKPLQNVTSRPRRPPVIDYDYYEDEEEPVVGKSTYNEKLFLTSAGTFRCLDQGNFPHPYSCKKFITCAKMVNGLVIGAEYTCPNKLSFDPVGGICNWSAGLGCKD